MALHVAESLKDLRYSTWSKGPVFAEAGRVGHTVDPLLVDGEEGIVTVGGANATGPFSDSHFFSWGQFQWRSVSSGGLPPRYEHCSFVRAEDSSSKLMVFGGGQEQGCLNDLYEHADGHWTEVMTRGSSPSPRTFHASASSIRHRDNIFVFGGGEQGDTGASAVADRRLHVLSLGEIH
eukprot:scpid62938/ scgid10903/ Rab9 effector protein with kelch motifs